MIAGLASGGTPRNALDALERAAFEARDALLAGDLERFGRALGRNVEAQAELHPSVVSDRRQSGPRTGRRGGSARLEGQWRRRRRRDPSQSSSPRTSSSAGRVCDSPGAGHSCSTTHPGAPWPIAARPRHWSDEFRYNAVPDGWQPAHVPFASALPLPRRDDVPASAVRAELAHILASDVFSRSERLSAFLKFVVEQTLDGHGDQLKEHVLAIELYGRSTDFSTAADPIVRVDARRLRDKLRESYASATTPRRRDLDAQGQLYAGFRRERKWQNARSRRCYSPDRRRAARRHAGTATRVTSLVDCRCWCAARQRRVARHRPPGCDIHIAAASAHHRDNFSRGGRYAELFPAETSSPSTGRVPFFPTPLTCG